MMKVTAGALRVNVISPGTFLYISIKCKWLFREWKRRKYFRVDDGDGGQSALICWIFDDFGHSRLLVAGQSEILRRTESDVVADWSGVVGQGQRQRIANCSTIWNFEFFSNENNINYVIYPIGWNRPRIEWRGGTLSSGGQKSSARRLRCWLRLAR